MKTKNLTHLLSVAVLLLWGGVMLYFYVTGRIANYLPPNGVFQPMVLISGLGLLVLALFNLITINTAEADCGHDHSHSRICSHDHGHEHHDDAAVCDHPSHHGSEGHHPTHENVAHNHSHGMIESDSWVSRIVAISILVLPLTLAALGTPDQFSPNAVANKGLYNPNYQSTARATEFSLKKGPPPADLPPMVSVENPSADSPDSPPADPNTPSYGAFTLADLEAQVPRSKAGNFMLEVPEIYYTGSDLEVQNAIKGQSIETIAQVLPEKVNNDDGRRLRIFRMLVQCCAADARPYSIPVEFEKTAPEFKAMSWVKVTGILGYRQEGGQTVPVIEARSIEETTAPDQSMMY